jgi:hypothetical protein
MCFLAGRSQGETIAVHGSGDPQALEGPSYGRGLSTTIDICRDGYAHLSFQATASVDYATDELIGKTIRQ